MKTLDELEALVDKLEKRIKKLESLLSQIIGD